MTELSSSNPQSKPSMACPDCDGPPHIFSECPATDPQVAAATGWKPVRAIEPDPFPDSRNRNAEQDAPVVEPEPVCGIAGCEAKHHPQDHNAAVEREANVWPLDPRVLTSAPVVEPEQPAGAACEHCAWTGLATDLDEHMSMHLPVAPKAQRDSEDRCNTCGAVDGNYSTDCAMCERARIVAIIEAMPRSGGTGSRDGEIKRAHLLAAIEGAQTNA